MAKRTDSSGLGSLRSGAITAASLVVVSAMSAAVGVVIAREFGRTEETDGLLAAYGVFVVIVIAAQAIRLAVLPQVARARAEGRLAGEIAGSAFALAVVAVPLVLVAELRSDALAGLLTGNESAVAKDTAADALRWMVPAACLHLFAALAASGLAALDDYGTAALGYAAGSVAGLALILTRAEPDGIVAVAWGITLNGVIALLVPVVGLAMRASRAGMPARAAQPTSTQHGRRLGAFAVAASLPLALQLLYVICLPFASRLGAGEATSFVYAYLAASALVAVTASSLGLVTSVPLARVGLDSGGVARHVVATSWLALVVIGGAAGVIATADANLVAAVLGGAFGGDIGSDLGLLIVVFSPWMVAAVGVTVTFPLAFVTGRTGWLPWIAVTVLALQAPLAWVGADLLELNGLALVLAASMLLVLGALLKELDALAEAARELARATGIVAVIGAAAFAPPALLLAPGASVMVGLLVYVAAFALIRPRGLNAGWRYVRALT